MQSGSNCKRIWLRYPKDYLIPLYFKSYGDGLESNEKSRTLTKRIYEGAS